MIFVGERLLDYEPGEIICVSESLQVCIDAVNNHDCFSYLGSIDNIRFSVWDNSKLISYSELDRTRWEARNINQITFSPYPITFEEVMKNMKEVKYEHL